MESNLRRQPTTSGRSRRQADAKTGSGLDARQATGGVSSETVDAYDESRSATNPRSYSKAVAFGAFLVFLVVVLIFYLL